MAKIIRIDDFNSPELDVYVRLTGPQLRNSLEYERGIFIAESPTVIEVALEEGYRPISLLTDERLLSGDVMKLIDKLDEETPVYVSSGEVLKKLTGFELTRGALAAIERPEECELSALLSGARRIAVLEDIADATNVGAIFRSAAALGIDAVLITPSCCDPLCRRSVRVSMGTVLKVPFAKICDSREHWQSEGVQILRSLGFASCAMALTDNSVGIDDAALRGEGRIAIILGTEGTGLSESTIAACDYTVKIPMERGVDSLNVGAAAAIAFYQLTR